MMRDAWGRDRAANYLRNGMDHSAVIPLGGIYDPAPSSYINPID